MHSHSLTHSHSITIMHSLGLNVEALLNRIVFIIWLPGRDLPAPVIYVLTQLLMHGIEVHTDMSNLRRDVQHKR